jgi:hypothetical protein
VNDGARALEGIIARWHKDVNGSNVAGGSATAITLTANQSVGSYYDGLMLTFEVGTTTTGSATLNVDGVGAKTIYKHFNQPLDAGDLRAGGKYTVVFNADVDGWLLVTPTNLIDGSDIRINTITGGHIAIGSDAQGDILYYDGANYTRLGAGTQGQFLQTLGSGQNPAWATAVTGGFAAQSDMETATSTTTVVSPGRTQNHPGVAKVTGRFDVAGAAVSGLVGYNSASVSYTANGTYSFEFDTDFSDSNAVCIVDPIQASGVRNGYATSITAGGTIIQVTDDGGSPNDPTQVHIVCYGDQ